MSGALLPNGNHVCSILSAESSKTRDREPQTELEVGNDEGTRKDSIVYGDSGGFGVRRVAALFRAAGVAVSNADQDQDGQLRQECVARLVSRRVGVVVYEGRIKGYVNPDVICMNEGEGSTR